MSGWMRKGNSRGFLTTCDANVSANAIIFTRSQTAAETGKAGSPARIVAPDPRGFALQKLWLAAQAKRNPLKRAKDAKQGKALLDAVATAMPQYPLDESFQRQLPPELAPIFRAWSRERPEPPPPAW